MVGNIGGQLGLWIGFSFTGLVAGILNVWYCARGKLSSKKHLGTGNERIAKNWIKKAKILSLKNSDYDIIQKLKLYYKQVKPRFTATSRAKFKKDFQKSLKTN